MGIFCPTETSVYDVQCVQALCPYRLSKRSLARSMARRDNSRLSHRHSVPAHVGIGMVEQDAAAQGAYTLLYNSDAACVAHLHCRHVALCFLGEQARRHRVYLSRLAQECGSQCVCSLHIVARALYRGAYSPDVVALVAHNAP